MQVLISSLVLVVALAATPAPNPFTLETPNPAATAFPVLPEIGRVRTASPPCAAMRDLVIPSFAAALRADKIFTDARSALPKYIEQVDQNLSQNPAFREMMLTRLDKQVTDMKQNLLVLNRALGDPRLSPKNTDPQVLAERAQLQQLYDTQEARANNLSEFVIRQQVAIAKAGGIDDNSALSGNGRKGVNADMRPTPTPLPGQTTSPRMPLMNGIAMSDKNTVNDWTRVMAADVKKSEEQAAKTFYPIAKSCR